MVKWNKLFGKLSKYFDFFSKKEETEAVKHDDSMVPHKLMESVKHCYALMDPFRAQAAVQRAQYAGKYGDGGAPEVVLDNKIRQTVKIYSRLLASGTPQSIVTPRYDALIPFAKEFEMAFNRHLKNIDLQDPMMDAVMQMFFSVGIIKTGLADGDEEDQYTIDGEEFDFGKAKSSSVLFDHFVVDVEANRRSGINFIGDRYWMPAQWVRDKKKELGTAPGYEDLTPSGRKLSSSAMRPTDRTSKIPDQPEKRLYSEVMLWDIYLPKQNLMCTFVDGEDEPLEVYEWDGPKGGPYDLLCMDRVPGEILPSSPISWLLPMHEFVNSVMRKLERQAVNQKTVHLYDKAVEDEAEAIRTAHDLDYVGVTNLNKDTVVAVGQGGADPALFNTMIAADNMYDQLAGGLKVLGGTEPMSETLGQDKLLRDSANAMIDEMRRVVRRTLRSVIKKHAWYVWTDPIRDYEAQMPIPGSKVTHRVVISPEVREGEFLDYNFDINPYSLSERTPQEEAATLRDLWEGVVVPNTQFYMQAGMMPDAIGYTNRIYELSGADSKNLFIPMNGQPAAGGSSSESGMAPMPPQIKQTTNTRISRPGHTQASRDAALMDSMSSLAQQGQGRPSGQ